MFDVITFGSATIDIFTRFKTSSKQGEICFGEGSKTKVEELAVLTGGGGTNTAATFANLGFRTAYCGKIGCDKLSEIILQDLKRFQISSLLLQKDPVRKNALSLVLSPQGKNRERAILTYEGACHFIQKSELPFQYFKRAKLLYLAPLYGKAADILKPLVKFARKEGLQVAVNPSQEQIAQAKQKLLPFLGKIDVLILNQEEARLLAGFKSTSQKVARKLSAFTKAVVVITEGRKGALVSGWGEILWSKPKSIRVVEKTGAGDAFGSGFTAGLLLKNNLKYAVQLGMANAEGCIQAIGAKNGLLTKKI